MEHGYRLGPHGLPLMGTGDWNDGMNKVGAQGKGESVWNGWFFVTVLKAFAELAERRGDAAAGGVVPERASALARRSRSTPGTAAGTAAPTSTTARRSARPRTTSARSTPSPRRGR